MKNSHFLALRSHISRCFDDPFSPIMVLIQLVAKAHEHIMETAFGCLRLATGLVPLVAVVVSLNAPSHLKVPIMVKKWVWMDDE